MYTINHSKGKGYLPGPGVGAEFLPDAASTGLKGHLQPYELICGPGIHLVGYSLYVIIIRELKYDLFYFMFV